MQTLKDLDNISMHNETFNLHAEYELFTASGKDALRTSGVIADPAMYPPDHDTRRGLGIFFFQEAIKQRSLPVMRAIHEAFPDEAVVYGLEESPVTQHVTFLELVGVVPHEEFEHSIRPLIPAYHRISARVFESMHPIHANFMGIAVNPTTIIMKGYPDDQYYNEVREVLREEIRKAGLPELKRRKVQIFHSTIARFIRPITDVEKLISLGEKFQDYDFGEDTFTSLHMASASWLMAESQIEKVYEYRLRSLEI